MERTACSLSLSLFFSFKRDAKTPPGEKGCEKMREKRVVGKARQVRLFQSGERAVRMTEGSLPVCVQLNFNFALDIDAMPQ